MRIVISAAVIRNGKLLLCRERQAWILPGGELEEDENDLACLGRELDEELGVELGPSTFFTKVQGVSPHKGDVIEVGIHFAEIVGDPRPRAEILEVAWVGPEGIEGMSDATIQAFQEINKEGRLF